MSHRTRRARGPRDRGHTTRTLGDTGASPPSADTAGRRRHLARLLWQHRWAFALGSAFLVATNFLALAIPRRIGQAVQALRDAESAGTPVDLDRVAGLVLAIVALALGAAATRIASRVLSIGASRSIEYDLRNEVFDHITRLAPDDLRRVSTGDLVSRLSNDINQLKLLLGFGLLTVVNTSVAYAVVLGKMIALDAALTFYALLPYPVFLVAMRPMTRALFRRTQAAQVQLAHLSTRVHENLSGAAVVKAFAIEDEASRQFRAVSDEYVARNLSLARIRGGFWPYMATTAGITTLVVIGVGGAAVIDGRLTLGQYVEFSAYAAMLAWPTIALGWVVSVWHRGTAAFDRIRDLMAVAPSVADHPRTSARAGRAPARPVRDIVFDHVSVEHGDGLVALDDVSLTIPMRSIVAVVGRTGAGKTTLVELLARLRDPTRGEIRIDGVPLRDIPLATLRGYFGFVPQQPLLFSTTIEQNVRFGAPAAPPPGDQPAAPGGPSPDAVAAAVEVAQLSGDLTVLRDGLQTVVGEKGVMLSGGQKQRVTIARALLGDPPVLVLDDALSSVDTRTEHAILAGLARVLRGRTAVLVTHRLHALEFVDRIVVLDRGRIVEQGTYRDLVRRDGPFSRMLARQRLEEELAT